MANKKQVIVIGGGLSGLTAADEIMQQNQNIQVTVLEANKRLGGRTWSEQSFGAWFDNGGQWVGPHQNHVLDLVKRANLDLISQNRNGKKVLDVNGVISYYTSDIPNKVSYLALIEMQILIWRTNKWAKTVPLDKPYDCKNAALWDSHTISSYFLPKLIFKEVKQLLEISIRAVFGAEMSEISMLYFLWYTHQSGSFENLVETKGNQDKKIIGGSQKLSIFLAKQIEDKGGEIILNQYVNSIDQTNKKSFVKIKTFTGEIYECDYVIVAMPPACANRIKYEPQLSYDKEMILQKSFMGSIIKTSIKYKTEFWKEKGFCGESASTCQTHPVINIFEDSRPRDSGEIQPSLVVFSNGSVSRYWQKKNLKEYHEIILETLKDWFQSEEALQPLEIKTTDWAENPYILGAPIGNLPPGVISLLDKPLFSNEGRIHWAGTEVATQGIGFLDGAVQSGKRAAKEILQRYQGSFKEFEPKIQIMGKQDYYVACLSDHNQFKQNAINTIVPILILFILYFSINKLF